VLSSSADPRCIPENPPCVNYQQLSHQRINSIECI